MNTAAVIGNAMTDYLLAAGTNKAPANRAPAHMAALLEARGYRIVRSSAALAVDPVDHDEVGRITAAIDWRSADAGDEARNAIVRQVISAIRFGSTVATERRRVAWMAVRYPSRFRPTIVRAAAARAGRGAAQDPAADVAPPSAPIPLFGRRGRRAPCSALCPCTIDLPGERA